MLMKGENINIIKIYCYVCPFFFGAVRCMYFFPYFVQLFLRPLVLICMCFLLQTSVVGTMLLLDLSLVVKKFQIAAM